MELNHFLINDYIAFK